MLLVLSMEDDNNKMAGETRRRVETDTDHREIDNVKADLFIQFFLLDRNYDIGTDLCEWIGLNLPTKKGIYVQKIRFQIIFQLEYASSNKSRKLD